MSYSAIAVANEFIRLSRRSDEPKYEVTNMKLQKLVYISHGYCLGKWSLPLITNDIHAFEWGPVIPVLYNQLKEYRAAAIERLIPTTERVIINPFKEKTIIQKVWDAYGHYDGLQLSRITHRPNTPWSETWAVSRHGIIDNRSIEKHYRKLLDERREIRPA